ARGHQAGLAQHLVMVARRRLRDRQPHLEAPDIALGIVEDAHDLQAHRVGERLQDRDETEVLDRGVVQLRGVRVLLVGFVNLLHQAASICTGTSTSTGRGRAGRNTSDTRPAATNATTAVTAMVTSNACTYA